MQSNILFSDDFHIEFNLHISCIFVLKTADQQFVKREKNLAKLGNGLDVSPTVMIGDNNKTGKK